MASEREVVSLSGVWNLAFDPTNVGKDKGWFKRFPKSTPMQVPGVWEQIKPGYDGVGWYHRTIEVKPEWEGKVLRVTFGAVMYYCEVWLNGEHLGSHEGGGSPFEFNITRHAKVGANELVVRVINPPINEELEGFRAGAPLNQGVLPVGKAAWYYNYGGIWQDVELVVTDKTYIDNVYVQPYPFKNKAVVNVTAVNTSSATTQEVRVAIREAGKKTPIAEVTKKAKLKRGQTTVSVPVPMADFRWWSPDDPFLYTATATIGDDEVADRFGMREFTIKGGLFMLNGKRITLKGYLQQEHYPKTLIFPETREFAWRELKMVKDSGCNFIRSHLKAPSPFWLDMCDELGILIEGEPAIGWIGKSPDTEARCRTAIEGLLKRDRNHPSVVFWCLMNEAYHFRGFTMEEIKKMTARLAAAGRKQDNTRLLLDTSGGGGGAKAAGGTMVVLPHVEKKAVMTDDHAYCGLPVSDASLAKYRTMGKKGVPLLISEFGAPLAPPDHQKVLASYTPAERKLGLEDYQLHKDFYDSLKEGFAKAGLRKAFGTADKFVEAIDAARADEIRLILAAQRCNPTLGGTAMCQLADASGELFGATDVFRNPKKVFAGMSASAQTPLVAPEITPRVQTPGDKAKVRLTLINEDEVGPTYTYTLDIVNRSGRSVASVGKGKVKATDYIQTLLTDTIMPELKPGQYALRATLSKANKTVMKRDVDFTVLSAIQPATDTIAAWDPTGAVSDAAKALGMTVEVFSNNYRNKNVPVFVDLRSGRVNGWMLAEIFGQLKKIVQTGGVAVLFDPQPMLLEDYLLPGKIRPARQMRVLGYVKDHPIFAGLPTDCVADYVYADVMGASYDKGEDVVAAGGEVIAGGLSAHMWTRPADYSWCAGVYTIPVDRGEVIVCHMGALTHAKSSPVAKRILANLADYAAGRIKPGLDHLLLSRCIDPIDPKELT